MLPRRFNVWLVRGDAPLAKPASFFCEAADYVARNAKGSTAWEVLESQKLGLLFPVERQISESQ